MQNPQLITFQCPNCNMRLQVPASMAGVNGPCPQCSATIAAPAAPPAAAASTSIPAPIPQQPAPQQQAPQQPAPRQQIPAAEASPQPIPQPGGFPQDGQGAQRQQAQAAQGREPAAKTAEKPQMAQQRKPTPSPRTAPEQSSLPREIRQLKSSRSWMRIVFPLLFLFVAIATVLVVLQAAGIYEIYDFKKDTKANMTIPLEQPPSEDLAATKLAGREELPASDTSEPIDNEAPSIPIIKPDSTPVEGEFPELKLGPPPEDNGGDTLVPGASSSPDQADAPQITDTDPPPAMPAANNITSEVQSPPTAGSRAYTILTQFLEAKTLEERLPLMSKSKLTREQLEQSCLAGPLKTVKSRVLAEMVPDQQTGMIQYLYFISFEDPAERRQRQRIVLQLVERPNVHPPRVHGDAFIDHYEKKFQDYAQNPSDEVVTFYCIVEARTADLAKNIPDDVKAESIRLVVKTHPNGSPIFNAIVNKNSPFMEKVGTGKEFPYTASRFCVLSFRWNKDNPEMPYIELNDILCQGWER